MKERLDWAVANEEWCAQFPDVDVFVLAAQCSDHKPLLVSFSFSRTNSRQPRQFQYEALWNSDSECEAVVQRAWLGGNSGASDIQNARMKLNSCQEELQVWSRARYRRTAQILHRKSTQLELLQREEESGHRDAIKHLQSEIAQLLEHEDMKWKQRAKRNWFNQGDRNSKFFHAWANYRRKRNHIGNIKDEAGVLWTKPDDVVGGFLSIIFRSSLRLKLPVA